MRMFAALRRRLDARGRDAGLTLIELLVASFLFLLLGSLVFTSVLAGSRTARNAREYNDLSEESRLVLNRMSRELREAKQIVAASNPAGSSFNASANTSLTFEVDFNGNNVIEPSAADPERLTYEYDAAGKRVLLKTADESLPVLAANVNAFKLSFTSRLYRYDSNADGVVTWEELDASVTADPSSTVGNGNGVLDQELDSIDSVTIDFTVLNGARRQTYRTQIDMRNRPY